MQNRYKAALLVTAVTATVAGTAAVAWPDTAPRRQSDRCNQVRAQVAEREMLFDAATAGGLTPEQQAKVAFEREINKAALRHCTNPTPTPSGSTRSTRSSGGGSSAPTSTAPASPSRTSSGPAVDPGQDGFPNQGNTGVPAGWKPATTRTTDLQVTQAGAVIEDVRLVGASIRVNAPNVTIRRVEIQGGHIINDPGRTCHNGLVVENVSLLRAPGQVTRSSDLPAIGAGGYTARGVKIEGLPEAFRVSGRSIGCGPVTIENSFASVRYPDECGDWHGDGIQGYDGAALTVRNVTLDIVESGACHGTAPFFYPANQGNTSVDIDRLLVKGGGFPFRLGMPGKVRGLRVADSSWGYGPIDVKCSVISQWEAQVVGLGAGYRPNAGGRNLPCNTERGT